MLSDLEITRNVTPKPITELAKKLGLRKKELELYGEYKAKVKLETLNRLKDRKNGKYILVTAITPTPLGEGKTVTTIGLGMALNRIGKKTTICIRQPSLGPVFGIKGGAAGGGYSQVIPMEDFNLHFTGDIHAVGLAHNLAAAFLDNHIYKTNKLNINLQRIFWRRVVDVSDRSLRNTEIGLGTKDDGIRRQSGFDITVSSEVMAILALAEDLFDLRKRLGRIVLAEDLNGRPVICEDIKVSGSMCALLKDAIKPNLIQTLEHTPCFVHAGPFANIAHGNSSIIADKLALKLSDFVVTEAGFGADCGAEKFFDIKCRASKFTPNCAVLVCSVRALKMHSNRFKVIAGKPLDPSLLKEDLESLEMGLCNLEKQIENILVFGIPCVVAINRFDTDSEKEIDLVLKRAKDTGADDCVVSTVFKDGSKGGIDLAKAVVRSASKPNNFKFLYPLDFSIKEKIETIAKMIYGAKSVEYSPISEEKINKYTELGWDKLPVCMAKTHLSLSHDPNLKGRPKDFILPIRDIHASIGAGFLYLLCGQIQTMPGLPTHPLGERIDINEKGDIIGLS